jgi:hypothetical protein
LHVGTGFDSTCIDCPQEDLYRCSKRWTHYFNGSVGHLAWPSMPGTPGPLRRRLLRLPLAGLLYVVVALSWLSPTLIAPTHDRPWAIGSATQS